MSEKGKVKFIRKNGRVIPVRSKGKSGSDKKMEAKKPQKRKDPKASFKRDVKRVKKFQSAGSFIGSTVGLVKGKGSLVNILGATALGGIVGGFVGKEVGISAGSIVKQRKGESQKKVGKRAVNRAERLRRALNRTSV